MRLREVFYRTALVCCFLFLPLMMQAQVTKADYERANGIREKYQALAVNVPERANWIEGTSRFWYRKSVKGGNQFMLADAVTLAKEPAFDHEKLAAALSKAAGEKYEALKLPFQFISFVNSQKAVEFSVGDSRWQVDLTDYTCKKAGEPAGPSGFRRRGTGMGTPVPIGSAPAAQPSEQPRPSPDGKWEAFIQNYNVFVRATPTGGRPGSAGIPPAPSAVTRSRSGAGGTPAPPGEAFPLSFDGSEGNYYRLDSMAWSPDSKKLAVYRLRPGYHRKIYYVESSPADQLQPKYSSMEYEKPGDALDLQQPILFDVADKRATVIDDRLFPNPYRLSRLEWRKDGRAFTFEYNQRGHQVYRVIEVSAVDGQARAIISEEPKTFFCYSGKKYRYDVADGKEMVWMSERDNWNHLYLYDGATGAVKNQITKGNWVVRGVEKVDEEKRQIWFRASGMYPGKDPYFVHYYRINFDGTGLTALTGADANHTVSFSPDMKYYTDTWSRVDLAPVSELRRVEDRKTIAELEHADIQELGKAGWRAPEVFTAPGRDGKTDISGIIIRPSNFDPKKKYPVVEWIYAGPQDSFVPKSFSPYNPMQSLAELGLIVVQIDGMGTSNRSKAFHDVCWKNLGDAGFPDRILWHKAVAAKYSCYDISRVGVYGNSAGGQSALGALLFHPEFYKVAVSSAGCHDNRMDKIWWNEQWMGWPLGPEYAVSSNVDNAWRLKGKLLLSVGEMDTNVDPASTMQVVNALIKADKVFDLIVLPGQGHGPGGAYGERKRYDFFVHHLLGVEPPDWNQEEKKAGKKAEN